MAEFIFTCHDCRRPVKPEQTVPVRRRSDLYETWVCHRCALVEAARGLQYRLADLANEVRRLNRDAYLLDKEEKTVLGYLGSVESMLSKAHTRLLQAYKELERNTKTRKD